MHIYISFNNIQVFANNLKIKNDHISMKKVAQNDILNSIFQNDWNQWENNFFNKLSFYQFE